MMFFDELKCIIEHHEFRKGGVLRKMFFYYFFSTNIPAEI